MPGKRLLNNGIRRLGPIPLAAQSVLLTSSTFVYMAPFSISLATSIRVGNALGSGQARKAKLAAETAIGMSVSIAILIGFVSKFQVVFEKVDQLTLCTVPHT